MSATKSSRQKPFYERTGMQNILLYVPSQLRSRIEHAAADQQTTLREVYTAALGNYTTTVQRAARSRKLDNVTFHATLRPAQGGTRFQMWIDPELGATIDDLCQTIGVSKRAFCYSALVHNFNA